MIAGQVTGARIFCSPGTDDVAQAFRVIPSRMDVSGIDLIFTHRGGSEILPLVFPRLGEELRIVFVDGDSITVPKSNSRHTFSEFVTDPRIARIEFTLTLENGKKVQLVLEHTASGIQLHERK